VGSECQHKCHVLGSSLSESQYFLEFLVRVRGQEVDQRKLGEIVEKDCRAHGLNMEDAMDCSRWRKQIRDD